MLKRNGVRLTTIAVSLVAGALVVTWGGADTMKPFSQDQLTAASCASQDLSAQATASSVSVRGLGAACADRVVRVTVLGNDHAVLAVVPARLRQVAGSAVLRMPLPPGVHAADVAAVRVAPLDV